MIKSYREQKMVKHICMGGKTETLILNNYAVAEPVAAEAIPAIFIVINRT